jgi:predicted HTH domain antitoxin
MIVLSSPVFDRLGLSEAEIVLELAIVLYRKKRLSYFEALELSGLERVVFDDLLSDRNISAEYTVADLKEDMDTLRNMRLKNGGQ